MATTAPESTSSVGNEGAYHNEETKGYVSQPAHIHHPPLTDDVRALARKACLKFDFFLVLPVLTMFYLLSFMDRVNIANARVGGLQADLKMTDRQYSLALTTTFVPYIIVEIPAGLVLKRIGANTFLPTMVILWGLTTTLQGLVKSYTGLLVARFFLGFFEGGMLPGVMLVMSRCYRRDQIQFRMALLFTAASLAGAFSGLLATAILKMDGRAGHRGWQWIFILEGLFTVAFGLVSFFCLPRTPTSSRFLSEKEKEAIHAVLQEDWTPDSDDEPFSWSQVIDAFKTPHVLILVSVFFFAGNVIFGLAFFAPTIIRSMGYSPIHTQLMSVPPYTASFVLSVTVAFFADRWGQRGYVLFLAGILTTVGYLVFLTSSRTSVLYGSIVLQTMGAFTSAPAISAWIVNNVQPHYKRSTAIALGLATANCGGILSTWIFVDPPRFRKATKINLAMSAGMCILAVVNRVWLVIQNKRKERERTERQPLGSREEEEAERRRLGDRHPDFIYTLYPFWIYSSGVHAWP